MNILPEAHGNKAPYRLSKGVVFGSITQNILSLQYFNKALLLRMKARVCFSQPTAVRTGHTAWERALSSRLAASANSTTISASARREREAFAAGPSKSGAHQGTRCLPSAPPPAGAAPEIPKGARCWQHTMALPKQGCGVGAMTLLQGQGRRWTTWGHRCCPWSGPRSASCSWISIWTTQLPPFSSCSQGNGRSLRIAKQLTGDFFLPLYSQLSVYDVDIGWK